MCRSLAVLVLCSVSSTLSVQPFSISFSFRPEPATARAAAVRRLSVRVPKMAAIFGRLAGHAREDFWACVAAVGRGVS